MALPSPAPPPVTVEDAVLADFPAIAALTVGVYRDEGLASDAYLPQLADVEGRAGRSQLLVARVGRHLVGAVALVLEGDFGETTESEDEAAFRMLVVDPGARGRGVGELLVTECLARARAAGKRRVVLSTDPVMTAAHRLYARLGFTRLPGRDWAPQPGIDLLVYALDL
ncbi:GNAT family N-acetyltransferase [Geodermatophilus sp. URMC 62]|uniref:GNAT family N-acetyltransferase n=1 Tax=Geodermatophilus sp. URMC 62 TaxID=3423414 RepID=UPI00406D1B6A